MSPCRVRADEEEICFRDQLKHTTNAEKVEQEGWDEEIDTTTETLRLTQQRLITNITEAANFFRMK